MMCITQMFSMAPNGSQNQQNVDAQSIAFLLLQVILIPCQHQFIDHKCRIWSRMKIMKHRQKVAFLMRRQWLNRLFRYLYIVVNPFISCNGSLSCEDCNYQVTDFLPFHCSALFLYLSYVQNSFQN